MASGGDGRGGDGPPRLPRRIAHFDLDTFFVSVARLLDPSLVGRPVLVGHDGPRGVVSSASYEARAFGCHSAQPMAEAKRRCPQAAIVPPDMRRYGPLSEAFHRVLREEAPIVESVGIDEAYADLTGLGAGGGEAGAVARRIRRRVRDELDLAVSCCIAGSRVTAKVGSDRAKPDGLIEVPVGGDAAFLAPLPLRELPLVGRRMGEELHRLGVRTIGDAAGLDGRWLERRFGKAGVALRERAQGRDDGAVRAGPRVAKSISREQTFATDITDPAELRRVLAQHAESVGADLRRLGKRCRTVSVKVRWPDFTTVGRSRTPDRPLHASAALHAVAVELLEEVFARHGARPVRLVGLAASNLVVDAVQLELADAGTADAVGVGRDERVDHALDALRERFGSDAVRRGGRSPGRRGWDPRPMALDSADDGGADDGGADDGGADDGAADDGAAGGAGDRSDDPS